MSIERTKVVIEKCTYYCDICDKETRHQCKFCGKEVCFVHRINDPEDYGSDYPSCYCEACWEIGKPFLEEYHKLRDKYYNESEVIKEKWRNACPVKK